MPSQLRCVALLCILATGAFAQYEQGAITGANGQGSFDAIAGPIDTMFDFSAPHASKLFLDAGTGVVLP